MGSIQQDLLILKKINVEVGPVAVRFLIHRPEGIKRMNYPAASCVVSLKDTETTLERSKLRGTDPKRD